MKRYIRTRDGKVYDTKYNGFIPYCDSYLPEEGVDKETIVFHFENGDIVKWNDIAKQADTIEELIEVGDLVRSNEIINEINSLDYLKVLIKCSELTELYTKQGNDYILVVKTENGERRVI